MDFIRIQVFRLDWTWLDTTSTHLCVCSQILRWVRSFFLSFFCGNVNHFEHKSIKEKILFVHSFKQTSDFPSTSFSSLVLSTLTMIYRDSQLGKIRQTHLGKVRRDEKVNLFMTMFFQRWNEGSWEGRHPKKIIFMTMALKLFKFILSYEEYFSFFNCCWNNKFIFHFEGDERSASICSSRLFDLFGFVWLTRKLLAFGWSHFENIGIFLERHLLLSAWHFSSFIIPFL